MGWRGFRWGGGKRMVENCVPWYCWHNWEGGGGKRMVQRGGGQTYQIFGPQKSKTGPIQNPEQPASSVLSLGGCGEEPALRLHLAFGTGLLTSDSNVRRIGHEGSLIGNAQPKKHGKPLHPRTSQRIPARNRKISARLPLPRFPPSPVGKAPHSRIGFHASCGRSVVLGVSDCDEELPMTAGNKLYNFSLGVFPALLLPSSHNATLMNEWCQTKI